VLRDPLVDDVAPGCWRPSQARRPCGFRLCRLRPLVGFEERGRVLLVADLDRALVLVGERMYFLSPLNEPSSMSCQSLRLLIAPRRQRARSLPARPLVVLDDAKFSTSASDSEPADTLRRWILNDPAATASATHDVGQDGAARRDADDDRIARRNVAVGDGEADRRVAPTRRVHGDDAAGALAGDAGRFAGGLRDSAAWAKEGAYQSFQRKGASRSQPLPLLFSA
jgi:hypothetical protein